MGASTLVAAGKGLAAASKPAKGTTVKDASKSRAAEAQSLYNAAKGNDMDELRLILNKPLQDAVANELLNSRYDDGYTVIITAAEAGHESVVSLVLQKRADPMLSNSYGQNALHMATLHGRSAVVDAILQNSDDEVVSNLVRAEMQGVISLTLAARHGHDKIVSSLLAAKSDLYHGDDQAPLMVAVAAGLKDTVALLAPLYRPDWRDSKGRTPLYAAMTAPSLSEPVVRVLAETADKKALREKYPFADDGEPVTLAEIARRASREDLVKILTPKPAPRCQCVMS